MSVQLRASASHLVVDRVVVAERSGLGWRLSQGAVSVGGMQLTWSEDRPCTKEMV